MATTTQRGYGTDHQKKRAHYERRMAQGEHFDCWRCGGWINPDQPWDLGHDDHDRTITRGPEHPKCNRATAGRKPDANRQRSADAQPRTRNCEICGTTYEASHAEQRTCSRTCGWELRRRNAPAKAVKPEAQRVCTECQQPFTTRRSTKRTCSPECSYARLKRQMNSRYRTDSAYRASVIERSRHQRNNQKADF